MSASEASTLTSGQGRREGRVSGHALKALRRSADLTQDGMAERLHVDLTTVQSWESGRRPLASMPLGSFRRLRHELLRTGVQPAHLRVLDDAIEADHFLGAILSGDTTPLSTAVVTRGPTELLLWPLTGSTPLKLDDVGTNRCPVLTADERRDFTGNLRKAVEHPHSRELLRRQCVYLVSFDRSASNGCLPETGSGKEGSGWSPTWAMERSAALSLARRGHAEALQDFITRRLTGDDECETANLNYWAYWLEEIDEPKLDDSFMATTSLDTWRGTILLRHLVRKMHSANPHLDLDVHTLWALLQRKSVILREEPGLATLLKSTVEALLDEGGVSARARDELGSVVYGIRMIDW